MIVAVHEPAAGKPRGLVVGLCGFTETGWQMEGYAGLDYAADMLGLRVVYPTPPGHFWEFNRAAAPLGRPTVGLALVEKVLEDYGVRQRPVLVGFSAGAYFINSMAGWWEQLPFYPAGVVSYAGAYKLDTPMTIEAPYPAMVIRNACDRLVTEDDTDHLVAAYRSAGIVPQCLTPTGVTPAVAQPGQRFGHFWDNVSVAGPVLDFLRKAFP